MARAYVTATLCVLGGCAGSAGPAPSSGNAALPPSSAPVVASAPPAPSLPPLVLTELPQVSAAPALSFRSPANGAILAPDTARDTPLELEIDEALLPSVELSLDGARARPLAILPESPKLGDLGDVGPGAHYLVAAVRSAPDEPARFSVIRFGVGVEPSQEPLVFCSRPEGTLYGPLDAPLLLDFVTDGFEPRGGSVRVRVLEAPSGAPRFEALLSSGAPRRFTLPAPLDFTVELELLAASGAPLSNTFARDRCEVTRNEVAP